MPQNEGDFNFKSPKKNDKDGLVSKVDMVEVMAPSRPVIDDLDGDEPTSSLKGFKKASKALTEYG